MSHRVKAGEIPEGVTRRPEPPISDPTDEIKLLPLQMPAPEKPEEGCSWLTS